MFMIDYIQVYERLCIC